jgi:hypothetical protein
MDFKTKRKYKKIANMFYSITYVLMVIFVTYLILIGTGVLNKNIISLQLFIVPICALPLIALLTMYVAQIFSGKRIEYIRKIKLYRQYSFFNQAITLVRENEFDKAVDIFNKLIIKHNMLADILLAFMMGTFLKSDDPKHVEKSLKKLRELCDCFNPEKVIC